MTQLAADIVVKYQTLNKAMNKGSTSMETLEKIAKRLGVSPAVFWEGERVLEVNEPLILQKLKKEAEDKALSLCPYFRMAEIEKAVKSLPDIIEIDNRHFTGYYSEEYVDGIKRAVPVNIRHVVPKKPVTSMQDIINQDPSQYQWN